MDSAPPTSQRISNLLRFGVIAEVQLKPLRCRVASGELVSDFVPVFSAAAGDVSEWNPPTPGEQVLLICADGDLGNAVALRGLYSDAFPAPSSSDDVWLRRHRDGATLTYNHALHRYEVSLPAQSKFVVTSPGGIETSGSVNAAGNVSAGTGASGSFTTSTGLTVMVQGGVITNIF